MKNSIDLVETKKNYATENERTALWLTYTNKNSIIWAREDHVKDRS